MNSHITRRDFGRGLAAILAAGVAPTVLAGGLRRGLAARLASMGGEAWKNPYVTDGLVAMWDAEWNAGGGKHDGSSRVWKDLTGNGNDIDFDTTASPDKIAVCDNYIDIQTGAKAPVAGLAIPYGVDYTRTVEIVYAVVNRSTTSSGWDWTGWADCGVIIGCGGTDTVLYRHDSNGNITSKYNPDMQPVMRYRRMAQVLKGIGNYSAFRNDGTMSTPYTNYSYSSKGLITFAAFSLGNASTNRYRVRRICAYNRDLTDEEMHANFLADSERGLLA